MSPHSCDPAVIQHKNLIRVKYGIDPLRYNNNRSVRNLIRQRLTELQIGFIVQSGETVIEYIDLRIFGNRPGNRQPLLLPSGNIGASLGYFRFILIWLFLDKIAGLGNLGRFANLLVPLNKTPFCGI